MALDKVNLAVDTANRAGNRTVAIKVIASHACVISRYDALDRKDLHVIDIQSIDYRYLMRSFARL